MKLKDIISSICFVLVFLVLFTAVTYALRPNDKTDSKPTMSGFYAEPKNTLSIIAVGSSSTYRYIVPAELYKNYGYTAYSMAIASMRGNMFKYYIEEAEKTQNPDLFLIDMRWFVKYQNEPANTANGLGKIRMSTDNMKLSLNRFNAVQDVVPKNVDDRLSYYLDIIKYHGQWQSLEFSNLFYNKKSKLKGYRSSKQHKAYKYVDYSKVTTTKELSDYSKPILIDLLEYCKKEDVNVLFTFSPYLATKENIIVQNSIEEIVKSYGFDLINTNKHIKKMNLDFTTDFYNSLHTNILGAVKYTNYLGKYISKNFSINTDHSEETVKAWNNTLKYWETRKKADTEDVWDKIKDS